MTKNSTNNQNVELNVELCGICPGLPNNLAAYSCEECKEKICSDCKRTNGNQRSHNFTIVTNLVRFIA